MSQPEGEQLEQGAAGDDCLLCDRVLALVGLGAGLIITAMAVDLLTGGAISAKLFGSRRDPAQWDTADGGEDGPPLEGAGEDPGAAETEAAAPVTADGGPAAGEVAPDA